MLSTMEMHGMVPKGSIGTKFRKLRRRPCSQWLWLSPSFAVCSVLPLARCNSQVLQSKEQFQAGWVVP